MSAENEDDYATVRIPKELSNDLEKLIGKKGFRTKAEIVKQAIRDLLNYYHELESKEAVRFEKINSDENGVKILDRTLKDDVEVYIKPNGIMPNSKHKRHLQETYCAVQELVWEKSR